MFSLPYNIIDFISPKRDIYTHDNDRKTSGWTGNKV